MQLSMDERKFYLKDFQVVASYLTSFSAMRLGALGGCITILSAVVTFGISTTQPWHATAAAGVMLLVVFTTLRVVGAVNRSVYIFNEHLSSTERKLGVVGFASYWRKYVRQRREDGASYAFVAICRLINVLVSSAILVQDGYLGVGAKPERVVVIAVSAGISLTALIMNEIYMRKEMDPAGFLTSIETTSDWAREQAWAELQNPSKRNSTP